MTTARREVFRTSILARIVGPHAPRVILLEAPAGYGKSTVVRQLARRDGGVLVVDCRGTATVTVLARRVVEAVVGTLPAVRAEDVAREAALAARDGEAWRALAVETWRGVADRRYVVFENAERLADVPDALAFVNDLLDAAPPSLRIAVCSRVALHLRVGRIASPHETLLLRADDLRFTRAEITAAFAGMGASNAAINVVQQVSNGWPMAVYLLRRLYAEGRLGEVHAVDDQVLGDYLADEVIELLADDALDVLLACAAIPAATVDDLAGALDDPSAEQRARRTMEDAPFLVEDGGVFEVHPLLRATLCARSPERTRRLLLRAATAHDVAGREIRAAELYLEAGDQHAAARSLRSVSPLWSSYAPPLAISKIVSQLDSRAILSNPALWNASIFFRRFEIPPYQWLEEGLTLWQRGADLTPDVRAGVMQNVVNVYVIRGALDDAQAFLAEYSASLARTEREARGPIVSFWQTAIDVYRGRSIDVAAVEALIRPVIGTNTGFYALWQSDIVARHYRMLGDEAAERAAMARALDAADASQITVMRMLVALDAAVMYWMQHDDVAFEEQVRKLEAMATPAILDGLRHFLDCVRGREAVPGGEKIHVRCWGWLIAAARTQDPDRRLALVAAAREAADESSQGYGIIVSRIASALVDAASRTRWLSEARGAAERLEATFLVSCIDALAREEPPPGLRGFVRRFSRVETRSCISVIEDAVVIDGRRIAVPDRSREILMYLADARRPVRRDELVAAIWPDEDPRRAARSLLTLVSRLRDTIGDRGIIVTTDRGYSLGAHIAVDVERIRADTELAERGALDDALRRRLLDALANLCRMTHDRQDRWEWFQRCARELVALAHRIAVLLAGHASQRRDPETLVEVGRSLLALDATDEQARAYVVRAHLLAGQTTAARREIQDHERAVREELGIEERSRLRSLMQE